MMILKVTKNKALHSLQTVYFLKYILRVKAWIFLKMKTSILVFAEMAIFHSIYPNLGRGGGQFYNPL